MNTEFFIAKRFSFDKEGKKVLSRSIVRLSVFAIALSIAVMIISLAVVTGFKQEIRNKVVGFGSHIQILNFDSNNSYESSPVSAHQDFLPQLYSIRQVRHIQTFVTKPGIIKAGRENQGIIAKGIGSDFDPAFFEDNLTGGKVLKINDSVTNDLMISRKLADMLRLNVGDELPVFFFAERPRVRRLKILGIYQTSLDEFDKQFVFLDKRHLQKIYGWAEDEVSGFEILIDDYKNLREVTYAVRDIAGFHFLEDGSRLRVLSIDEKYPQIFQWLNLLNMNVWVILTIMIVIALINMISGLIIMILDRTNSIGLLKALGASNNGVETIFRYQSLFLIIKGLGIGNIIALSACILQDKFQLLKLDQASYFIDFVPVNLNLPIVLLPNLGALAIIYFAMYLPTMMISRIDPVKTLRFN